MEFFTYNILAVWLQNNLMPVHTIAVSDVQHNVSAVFICFYQFCLFFQLVK